MGHPIEALRAGDAFRNTLVPRADFADHGAPLWHGWAIMDAFLAGVDWAREQDAAKTRAPEQQEPAASTPTGEKG